ncbi:NAD(P)H-dependent oxidoreductase [Neisseria bacilliformis]|uniref:NAD(P)H-dependent oxidoreductase n=1 Tax=Neisseria bacilliformis TaxID=267212 RepID=UPI000667C921|nr:NAD(P)H-dependent oxidoreductase [Neisseria bacilliformis]
MSKTLVIAAHPNIAQSAVNKRWLAQLRRYSERFTVHELYAAYPDGKIDIAAEQRLADAHQTLVLQFPVYWFNCPPLLKQWLDDVKKTAIAVSLGTPAADYTREGAVGCTVAEALRPFELSLRYCNADYRPMFAFHTIDSNAGYTEAALQAIEQSAVDYVAWLDALAQAA